MQFSEIKSLARRIVRADSTDYPDADCAQDANIALDEILTECILPFTGTWPHDDYNQTSLPVFTTNIVAGTAEYDITSDVFDVLRINKVLAQYETGGDWHELEETSFFETDKDDGESYLQNAEQADPVWYRLQGNKIILHPTPKTSVTNGLKLLYDRTLNRLAADDDEPGFTRAFHDLVALIMARQYALTNKPEMVANIEARVQARKLAFQQWMEERVPIHRITPAS